VFPRFGEIDPVVVHVADQLTPTSVPAVVSRLAQPTHYEFVGGACLVFLGGFALHGEVVGFSEEGDETRRRWSAGCSIVRCCRRGIDWESSCGRHRRRSSSYLDLRQRMYRCGRDRGGSSSDRWDRHWGRILEVSILHVRQYIVSVVSRVWWWNSSVGLPLLQSSTF
jgi:hypothetical protein